jgi:hypothetical protein
MIITYTAETGISVTVTIKYNFSQLIGYARKIQYPYSRAFETNYLLF